MTIPDVITAISVAIAAIAFVSGVNAWKREYVGKRRIDLAENILALFYEAQDAIREIRYPNLFFGEARDRKRSEDELEEDSEILDQAYVVFERYRKKEKLFAELRSLKYRVMATFGSRAGEPFDELSAVLEQIFGSARLLTYYSKVRGGVEMNEDEYRKHLERMNTHGAILWLMDEEKDDLAQRVQHAVEKIELITRESAMLKASSFGKEKRDTKKRA